MPQRKSRAKSRAAPTVTLLADQAAFEAALDALALQDAAFVAAVAGAGERPGLRRRDPGFEGLARIIVSQQVSTASANAIFSRLQARFVPFEPSTLAAASDADHKLCGLSIQKIRALRALADAVAGGGLDFAQLALLDADNAHATLVAIKGIGPWTADVFLLFCLGHADAWPAGDLALQEAARLTLGLAQRPTTKEMQVIGERWRPLRGVAAHCLWAYYRASRGRAATLDATPPPSRPA